MEKQQIIIKFNSLHALFLLPLIPSMSFAVVCCGILHIQNQHEDPSGGVYTGKNGDYDQFTVAYEYKQGS